MSGVRVRDKRRLPFFMVGKPDLARLADVAEARMLPYARSVYFALLEMANDHRTDEVPATRAELAQRAGVSSATVKRCAPLLVDSGLVTVEEVPGYANVWMLLSAEGVGSAGVGGSGLSAPGGGSTGPAPIETVVQEGKKEEENATRSSRESDDVAGVWRYYQAVMPNGSRYAFSPTRRQLIRNALKVRTVVECKRAIDGLSKSEYHVRNGYRDIKYAVLGGGRSPTPEATIDRLSAIAENGNAVNGNGQRNGHSPHPDLDAKRMASVRKLAERAGLTEHLGL